MSYSLGRGDFGVGASSRAGKRRRELTEEQREEAIEAFELFDADKDGKLDYYELKVALRALGFEVKKQDVLRILKEANKDGSELIDRDSFVQAATDRMLDRNPMDEIAKAFKLFDEDGSGTVTLDNLRRVARELGENMNDDELQAMIEEFSSTKSGTISQEDFVSIMTSEY
eukprot:m.262835 g.262835  ORF g.262835 m.262835 type:complete len:171 (+) comp47321_c0_seq1:99-611(+)